MKKYTDKALKDFGCFVLKSFGQKTAELEIGLPAKMRGGNPCVRELMSL
jgi:hypothetical protein